MAFPNYRNILLLSFVSISQASLPTKSNNDDLLYSTDVSELADSYTGFVSILFIDENLFLVFIIFNFYYHIISCRIIRVFPDNLEKEKLLNSLIKKYINAGLNAEFWRHSRLVGDPSDIFIEQELFDDFQTFLHRYSITYSIIADDVSRWLPNIFYFYLKTAFSSK
jgi:hypothetical protein